MFIKICSEAILSKNLYIKIRSRTKLCYKNVIVIEIIIQFLLSFKCVLLKKGTFFKSCRF